MYLLVIIRVEVQIMKNDCVSCSQVDTQASCSGGENEDEDVLFLVELVDHLLPVLDGGLAVQPHVPVPTNLEIPLKNIQQHREL